MHAIVSIQEVEAEEPQPARASATLSGVSGAYWLIRLSRSMAMVGSPLEFRS